MLVTQQFATVAGKLAQTGAFYDLGKEMSFADARARVAKLSYLYHHELGPKPRIAIFADNHPSTALSFLAFTNIRAVSILMNSAWTPDEILAALKDTQATHVAVTHSLMAKIRDVMQVAHIQLPFIEIEKKQGGEYDSSYTVASDQLPVETDPILLIRTSGYSGRVRWCSFTHKQLLAATSSIRSRYRLTGAERLLSTLNWAHPFGLVHGMLLPLLGGATCVVTNGFEGSEFLDLIAESRASRLIGAPQDFVKLLSHCKSQNRRLANVRSISVGMGILTPEVISEFRTLGVQVSHVYGMTEALWTLIQEDTQPVEGAEPPPARCIGTGLPGFKYKIVDVNGDEVESEDVRTGQLCVNTPTTMTGYFGKGLEMETKSMIRGTWLYTGDIVTLESRSEEEGGPRFRFLGRKDDVAYINDQYASMNRINTVLKKIPGTLDGAAFTVKNLKGSWTIGCVLVKAPGTQLTAEQVTHFAREKLPQELVPAAVFFIDHIPRDAFGNVHYVRLRGQFTGLVS